MRHRSAPQLSDLQSRGEVDFSPFAAARLGEIFHLFDDETRGENMLGRVVELTGPLLTMRLPARQRMFTCYALGRALRQAGHSTSALPLIEDAIELATRLHEWSFRAEFLYVAASIKNTFFQHKDAAEYYELVLDSLNFAPATAARDLALEHDALTSHAYCDFMREEFRSAALYLDEARPLAALLPDAGLSAGGLEWHLALLHRWQGLPEQALYHGKLASHIYERLRAESPAAARNAGRLRVVVADILLDLAEDTSVGADSAQEARITQALDLAREAVHLTRAANDPFGERLALLARARGERVAHLDTDRTGTIERVLRFARQHGDHVLAAQCYTALGRELSAQDKVDAALNAHRLALSEIGGSDASAMTTWSKRALLRAFRQNR